MKLVRVDRAIRFQSSTRRVAGRTVDFALRQAAPPGCVLAIHRGERRSRVADLLAVGLAPAMSRVCGTRPGPLFLLYFLVGTP